MTESFNKHRKTAEEWQIPNADGYARSRTEKECYDAFQSLEYEVNTLHTANGQTPFVTFGFGLGTSWESRLIQQSILRNRISGLGKNRKTAVFPKLVFAIRDGLNHKFGDPNYDIKQLALECASKRMYPDILNYDRGGKKSRVRLKRQWAAAASSACTRMRTASRSTTGATTGRHQPEPAAHRAGSQRE